MRAEGRAGQKQTRVTLPPGGWGQGSMRCSRLSSQRSMKSTDQWKSVISFNSTPSVSFSNGPALSACMFSHSDVSDSL